MSASGKISYESTAVTSGLLGCLSLLRSTLSVALNDASMSRICADRLTSTAAFMLCFLDTGKDVDQWIVSSVEHYVRFLRGRWARGSFAGEVFRPPQPCYVWKSGWCWGGRESGRSGTVAQIRSR